MWVVDCGIILVDLHLWGLDFVDFVDFVFWV